MSTIRELLTTLRAKYPTQHIAIDLDADLYPGRAEVETAWTLYVNGQEHHQFRTLRELENYVIALTADTVEERFKALMKTN